MVLCDRVDQYNSLLAQGVAANLGEFAQEDIGIMPATIVARISKQKALVHHWINLAFNLLPPGGELWLAGFKNEGLKTYAKKASKLFGGSTQSSRGKNTSQLFRIEKKNEVGEFLPDEDYTTIRWLEHEALPRFSKPGIYGWNKVDRGSQLLMDTISPYLEDLGEKQSPTKVLDAGCGYGYLSLRAFQASSGPVFITAVDNHLPAVRVCQKNFQHYGVQGEVLLSALDDLPRRKFDALVCNPPFHRGFEVSGDLAEHFLSNCHRALKPGAAAWFVVNQFIPLPRKAGGLYRETREIARAEGFAVYQLIA